MHRLALHERLAEALEPFPQPPTVARHLHDRADDAEDTHGNQGNYAGRQAPAVVVKIRFAHPVARAALGWVGVGMFFL